MLAINVFSFSHIVCYPIKDNLNFEWIFNSLQTTNQMLLKSRFLFFIERKRCKKRRKCWLSAFSPFPTMFSLKSLKDRIVQYRVNLSYGNAFSLDNAKIFSSRTGWFVVLGFNATLTAQVILWQSLTHKCFLAFSHQYQHNFLSKATKYFSHLRWEAKIRQKENSHQPRIEITITKSWVMHAHHWATRMGLIW